MSTDTVAVATAAALAAFTALAFVDGVWTHLLVLRLHARPESRLEHRIHTARGVLFAALLVTLFGRATGAALWCALALAVADQALEVADMAIERRSRRALGGLGSGEYVVHGLLMTFRSVAIGGAFVLRPAGAWSSGATFDPGLVGRVSALLLPGAVVGAVAHVALAIAPGLLPARDRAPARSVRCCAWRA